MTGKFFAVQLIRARRAQTRQFDIEKHFSATANALHTSRFRGSLCCSEVLGEALSMKLSDMFALSDVRRQISGKRLVISLAAAICFAGPIMVTGAEAKSNGVRSIELAQQEPGAIVVYNVVLDRRFDSAELDSLSHRIKRTAPKVKLVFISYFLRGMRFDQEPWARSHFNPNLDNFVVRINEATTVTNLPDKDLRIAAGR
jgi:hypothetical protein